MYLMIFSIILSLLYFYMGLYAYFVQKTSTTNRIFLLLTVVFSGWSLAGAFFNTMNIPTFASVWMATSYGVWTIGTALILHFCLSLKTENGRLKPSILASLYIPALIMFLGMFIFNGLKPSNDITPTPLHLIFGIPGGIGFYSVYTGLSVYKLISFGFLSDDTRRERQSMLVSRSLIVSTILIALYGFVLPPLVSKPLPVLLPFFPTIWIVSMWIAITKYGFLTLNMELATKKILDNIQELIILTDKKYVIIDVNKKFEETVNMKKDALTGRVLHDVLSKNEALLRHVESVSTSESPYYSGDVDFYYNQEKYLPIRIHISPIEDQLNQTAGVIISGSDLSLEKEYERLSITDSLTNINNRMKTEHIIVRLLSDHAHFSLILFDLDFFKSINDEFGHTKGDHVLVKIAELITNELRATDYIGRWGGEEFIVILPETHGNEAFQISERIRNRVAEYDFGLNRSVTISLGISESNSSEFTLTEMFRRADEALYEAKQSGRNNSVLYSEK